MKKAWQNLRINEVCIVVDCQHKTAPIVDYKTPYKMLRTTNIRNGFVDGENVNYVTGETYEAWSVRGTLECGDIVLSREAPMGEVGFIKSDDKFFLGQRLLQLKALEAVINPEFLFYSLRGPLLQNQIRMHDGVGSVVSNLRIPDLKSFTINVPERSVQDKIADILGSIDDKIELNRRINETLEQMAMALHQNWFVDGEQVVSDAKVEDFAKIIGGGTPKTTVEEFWGGDIPWVSVKDLSNTFVYHTEKTITQKGLQESSTKLIPERSTIISARGTIGELSITGRQMTMNQSCYAFHSETYPYFTYLSLKSSIDTLKQNSHGSVFNTITKETIQNLDFPFEPDVCIRFEEYVGPWFFQIDSNLKEIMTLTETREYLLARLLSGEIEVKVAEEQVEEVLAGA